MNRKHLDRSEDHWRVILEGAARVEFPLDRERVPSARCERDRVEVPADHSAGRRLREMSRDDRMGALDLLAAAWATMLARYAMQHDVVIGVRSGATRALLPIRLVVERDVTVRGLVRLAKEAREAADRHSAGLSPTASGLEVESMATGVVVGAAPAPELDIALHVGENADTEPSLAVHYDAALYERESVARLANHFATLLESFFSLPDERARRARILDDDAKRQILRLSNGPTVEGRWERVDALVRRAASQHPDRPALEHGDEIVTYRELVERAHRLAHWLRRRVPERRARIALFLERSPDFLIAQLAVWAAGHAFIPFDVEWPRDRIATILREGGAALVLCSEKTVARLDGLDAGCAITILEDVSAEVAAQPADAPRDEGNPEDVAYIIFTSGTTGVPKGVINHHRGFTNWLEAIPRPGNDERYAQLLSFGYDAALGAAWMAIFFGGTLVFMDPRLLLSPREFLEAIVEKRITRCGMPSSAFEALLDADWGRTKLRSVGTGLEKLRKIDKKLPFALNHGYGPTECTIGNVAVYDAKVTPPPIGRPDANTAVYLLDDEGELLPQGALGEAYIGGVCVGYGYLDPETTAASFVPDPFGAPGSRMYRTGDVLRWKNDDNLWFCGRADRQIKLRGYRIEPSEIESALCLHEEVTQALVVPIGDPSRPERLVGYVVSRSARSSKELSSLLRTHLRSRLPPAMIPSAFVAIDRIPTTLGGKIDYRALPPPAADTEGDYVAPRTALERALADAWSDVLHVERVSATDDFSELGGHSLAAGQVAARLRAVLGVDVPVATIFDNPKLADLASALERAPRAVRAKPLRIEPIDRTRPMELSSSEERLWFLELYEPGSATYNVPDTVHLDGRLDVRALERALMELVQRHEALRTRFIAEGGVPKRIVDPVPVTVLESVDVADTEAAEQLVAKIVGEPFDLAAGPLFRATLIRVGPEAHVLVLLSHHIITDGWSGNLVREELAALYNAFTHGRASPLAPPPFQFADWAAAERNLRDSEQSREAMAYWRAKLSHLPALDLPTDRPRPSIQSHAGALVPFVIDTELTSAIHALARRERASVYMILLAAFAVTLSRCSGQRDFAIGTPVAGREHLELEKVVGFFANTLALRVNLSGDATVAALLAGIRESTLGAYEHQTARLEQLVADLGVARDTSRSPLFQVFFAMNNAPVHKSKWEGVTTRWDGQIDRGAAMFDLSLLCGESRGRIYAHLEYCTALFEEQTVARMARYFQTLLAAFIAEAGRDVPVSALPMMDRAERRAVVEEFNATDTPFVRTAAHHLFEAQAERTPEAMAASFDDESITYAELDRRANRLAHCLIQRGVRVGARVALSVSRSINAMVAVLGILKAGAAYVPLDPSYPEERLRFMLEDSKPSAVVTETALLHILPETTMTVLCLDRDASVIAEQPDSDPARHVDARCPCYVIYTSGSTGRPKAVVMPHGPLVNLIHWQDRVSSVHRGGTTLQFTPLSFDVSFQELFSTWHAGGCLVLVSDDVRRDPQAVLELLVAKRVERLFLPFVALKGIAEAFVGGAPAPLTLKSVVTAGEQLQITDAVIALFERLEGCALHNHYGPSEAHVVSAYTLTGSPREWPGLPPIGRPIANARLYVLDREIAPVPMGVRGELYIGGLAVADGYFGRPDITAERFIPDPFSFEPGARLYKTGDLARINNEGQIEYLGRADTQVKVRGYRIEPGEIEVCVASLDGVRGAAVVARKDTVGEMRIFAYVVGTDLSPNALDSELRRKLPAYMIPSAFVVLDELPLTPSGKVDRKALPDPKIASSVEYVAPRNASEETLARIWIELLGVERVGAFDDFFALGGQSLLAARLVARIKKELGVEVGVRHIFEKPTVASLAEQLNASSKSASSDPNATLPAIVPVSDQISIPMTFAQEHWWQWERTYPGTPHWNLIHAFRLRGPLDIELVRAAVEHVAQIHEPLRTSFREVEGRGLQEVCDTGEKLVFEDLSVEGVDGARRRIEEEAQRPFVLIGKPLHRGGIFRCGPNDHVLWFVTHHLCMDGWGVGIFVSDLFASLEALSQKRALPPPPTVRFRDFACWERALLTHPQIQSEIAARRKALEGAVPLELHVDRPRTLERSPAAVTAEFMLEAAEMATIDAAARRLATTRFAVFVAAVDVVLARETNQRDLVHGIVTARRHQLALHQLLGNFTLASLLRVNLAEHRTGADLVNGLRTKLLDILTNSLAPLQSIIDSNNIFTHPLGRISVNMPPTDSGPGPSLNFGDVHAEWFPVRKPRAHVAWERGVTIVDAGTRARVMIGGAAALIDQNRLESFASDLRSTVLTLATKPEAKLEL